MYEKMKELGPIGGVDPLGWRGPLMWALFTKNTCKNKRIGSHRAPRSTNAMCIRRLEQCLLDVEKWMTKNLRDELNKEVFKKNHKMHLFNSAFNFMSDFIYYEGLCVLPASVSVSVSTSVFGSVSMSDCE